MTYQDHTQECRTESQELRRRLALLTAENRLLRERGSPMAATGAHEDSFDLVPVMMYVIDEQSTIRYANQRCLQELGYEKHEIVGRPMQSIMTPQSASKALLETLPGMWELGGVRGAGFEYVKKDGTVFEATYEWTVTPQPDGRKSALCVIRDVSVENRGSEALRQLTVRLEKRISERAEELTRINLRLLKETADRMRAQQELKTIRTSFIDIGEKSADGKPAEEKNRRQSALLEAVNKVFRETLHMRSPEEVARTCVQVAQEITGCPYGWIGELQASGDLVPIAFSDSTGDHGEKTQHGAVLQDSEIHGIWESVIGAGTSTILTETVVPVLAVPLKRAGSTFGIIALAGKPGGIYPEDMDDVEALSPAFVQALDRSRAEHALRESEQRFRQLAENIGEIFWLTTPGDPLRIAYVSPALETITGTSCAHVVGKLKTDAEFIYPEDRDKMIDAYLEFVEGHADYAVEFRIVRPDGSIRWMWEKGFKVWDEDGRLSRIAGITEDITCRKRQEAHQEQLVDELKNFAYIISHDLRAPLINLKGYSGELRLALETIRPCVDMSLTRISEEQQTQVITALEQDIPEALGFIDSSVSAMEDLTNAILRLSRLGRRELKFEQVSMHAVTQEVINSSAFQFSRTHAKVEVGPLPNVVADRVCMEQIMSNLISNAVKYRDPNRPALVEVTGETLHDEWVFRVKDNGRGIHSSDMHKIFDMFRRVGSQDVPGEGMGLAFVRTLVWRHGGRIWCASTPGVGSTFVFAIPTHLASRVEQTIER